MAHQSGARRVITKSDMTRIHPHLWEVPASFRDDMRVPARVYASETMLDAILGDRSLEQLVNVATLPGIQSHAVVMPDAHEGYGFPIGGVAAFDPEEGIISPGGIGYDINCGVRLLRSELSLDQAGDRLASIARSMAKEIPSGAGRGGALNLKQTDFDRVMEDGAARLIEMGYGLDGDLEHIESRGRIDQADPSAVSDRARSRGRDQIGTLGSGNHFLEIDVIDTVYDEDTASELGLRTGQLVVLIHTGSRGFGHQIATDSLRVMTQAMARYGIEIPDRELACAPFRSPEGQQYFGAMAAGANFAFANRQMITSAVRAVWDRELGADGRLDIVYDVAHNIAKIEEHEVGGRKRDLVVHRKGATRAFPGQPVIIPGSMGTASYLLKGQERAMVESFGSSCHGAGRTMSRSRAKREIDAQQLRREMKERKIVVEAGSLKGLVEEAPEAYKDIDSVIDVVNQAGIASKVVRLRPVAVVKG